MGLSRGSNIEGGEQGEETGIILRKKLEVRIEWDWGDNFGKRKESLFLQNRTLCCCPFTLCCLIIHCYGTFLSTQDT